REALARLEYAVEEKELALLVGDIGSGKTTLSRALIDRLGESRPVVLLINPRLTPTQLLRSIAAGLGLQPGRFRNDLLDQIHTKLYEIYEAGREPVLIVDEAQLIPSKATFDEIPRLINTLATTALLDAFGEDAETIDPQRVVAAAREHRLEAHG